MEKLYLEVRSAIREKIDSGAWPVGYKLPREMELCEIFRVGRGTVRRALSALVGEGLLHRVKGTGTFVSRPQIFDETTFFVQSFAKELKSQGLTARTEVLECRYLAAPDARVASALRLSSRESVFKLRRLRYSEELGIGGPITLTVSYFPCAVGKEIERCDFETVSLYDALKRRGIVRAHSEKTITATRLPEKDCRLLSSSADDLFLLVTTVSYDRSNTPIEYCESLYPVDRNTFRLHVVTDAR